MFSVLDRFIVCLLPPLFFFLLRSGGGGGLTGLLVHPWPVYSDFVFSGLSISGRTQPVSSLLPPLTRCSVLMQIKRDERGHQHMVPD